MSTGSRRELGALAMGAPAEGEARVLATAQHIVKALGTTDTMTDDMLHILSKFDHRFSCMHGREDLIAVLPSSPDSEEQHAPAARRNAASSTHITKPKNYADLDAAEQVVVEWDNHGYSSESTHQAVRQEWIFDSDEYSTPYLRAVDEIITQLGSMKLHNRDPGALERAQRLLHLAGTRLEAEFRHMLETHSERADPDWLLLVTSRGGSHFRAAENAIVDPEPAGSSDDDDNNNIDDDDDDIPVAHPVDRIETSVDLVPPHVAAHLADIAKRLVGGGFKRECTQLYVSKRRMVLDESLYELGVERVTIDEVDKMQWEVQEARITKWIQAMNVGVRILLASERHLCNEVFPSPLSGSCFIEIGRRAMIVLLSFGEAIAVGRHSPEKLFKVLDMYETVRDVIPELEVMFDGVSGASVRAETQELLLRLGEAARGTFAEFESAIQRDVSKVPGLAGAVHPLNRYVMNYINLLCDSYSDTLEQLFGEKEGSSPLPLPSVQISWLLQVLHNNLETKSKVYKDVALSSLFLMNNAHYMVRKVKGSAVGVLVGDDWVKKHTGVIRQYATTYQRAAWSKVLAFLKDEGIPSLSSRVGVSTFKERLKSFNAAFGEAHRVQSQWVVCGDDLRDELLISIAEKLLPAYRAFVGRYGHFIDTGRNPGKYIKYSEEDLEIAIGDLFSGTVISRRRSLPS